VALGRYCFTGGDMATAFDGSYAESIIRLPCKHTAYFDQRSGYGYICSYCLCVVGAVSMPDYCRELLKFNPKEVVNV